MNVITLKDYAKTHNISYEAVRKQVTRYKKELAEHIIQDGRQQFLDDEAVAFLNAKRQKNPVVIIQQDKDETIEALRREKENLLLKVTELSDWKAENAVAIAEANQQKLLLENKEKEIKLLEVQNADLSAENKAQRDKMAEVEQKASDDVKKAKDELEKEKKKFEDEKHLLKQRAETAETELQAVKEKNQELENRTLGDYLKGLFRKKGKKDEK